MLHAFVERGRESADLRGTRSRWPEVVEFDVAPLVHGAQARLRKVVGILAAEGAHVVASGPVGCTWLELDVWKRLEPVSLIARAVQHEPVSAARVARDRVQIATSLRIHTPL